jgi:hypothetical protein
MTALAGRVILLRSADGSSPAMTRLPTFCVRRRRPASCVVVTLLLVAALSAAAGARQDATLQHVRVAVPGPVDGAAARAPALVAELAAELAAAGFDVLHGADRAGGAGAVELVVSTAERRALESRGLDVELLARGQPFASIQSEWQLAQQAADGSVPAGYLDRPGIEAAMAALAAAHPERAELVDLTLRYGQPATSQGNHLFALRISDDVSVEQDEPAVLLLACQHAREIVTPLLALDHAARLLQAHGVDPQLTAAVDGLQIWIAPLWNPDGYDHVFLWDNLWRKNRTPFGPAGLGVDLNRNSPFDWDSPCAGSSLPSSATYKGPLPGSEVETATLLAFAADQRFAKLLDYHSAGQEVLYSYACASHPLGAFLQAEAVALSEASGYGGAVRLPSAEGEQYEWQLAASGAFAFLTETATTFQPLHSTALAEAALTWPGTRHWLLRPITLSGHVTDACTGLPLQASLEVAGLDFGTGETLGSGGPLGRYHLFLPDGNWTLAFSAPGYAPAVFPLAVSVGGGQVADVALIPLAPATGCWTDLGFALAGTDGEPRLEGAGTLLPGSPTLLALTGALESTVTWLVVGVARWDFSPFYGGTLVPDLTPPGFFAPLATDAAGSLGFSAPWPAGLPPGSALYFQHWVVDPGGPYGFAASNAVQAAAP